MFAQWKEAWKRKREERKKRKADWKEIKEWDMKHYHYVSFCLQDVEFMDYDIPFNLTACGNELSLYESTEKSFHEEVCTVFREIAEELTQGYHVLQWVRWFGQESMTAKKKYMAGKGALFTGRYIMKCTENGADADLLELQLGKGNEWTFIEQECFCYKEGLPIFTAVEDGTDYIEEVPCDLYIMLDLEHSAMMVKTREAEDLKTVENCMRNICAKYEKEIHDYIGYLTQKST